MQTPKSRLSPEGGPEKHNASCYQLVSSASLGVRDNVHTMYVKEGDRGKTKKGGVKGRGGGCGWDLFSVWPLLPLLKRKVAGVMSVYVSNASEWQEVVCHWSSLPISPPGPLITSTTPATPSDSRSGTWTHTHTHNYLTTTSVLDHFSVLGLLQNASWPPPTLNPQPAQFLPHFASPLRPCSCTLLPLSFPGSSLAMCDEWDNITLVLCWPGLTAPTQPPPPHPHLSVCLSVSPSGLSVSATQSGWA